MTIDANGRVTELALQNNALSGKSRRNWSASQTWSNCGSTDNQLTGEIPAALGRMENLTLLHLSGNQLTGCVPAALMDVADNDFDQLGLPFCAPATAARAFSCNHPCAGRAGDGDRHSRRLRRCRTGHGDAATGVRLRIQQSPRWPGHGHRPSGSGGNLRADRRDILHLHRYRARHRGFATPSPAL